MALKRITTKEGEVYFVDANTGERVNVKAKSKPSDFRFNTLLSFGHWIAGFGWVAAFASVIFMIMGIEAIKTLGIIAIISGAMSLIMSFLVVAIGQSISCFVSIEQNTFETVNLLKSMQNTSNQEKQL